MPVPVFLINAPKNSAIKIEYEELNFILILELPSLFFYF